MKKLMLFVISAIAKKGVFDCLLEVNKYITRDRKRKDDELVEEKIIVIDMKLSALTHSQTVSYIIYYIIKHF